LLYAPSSILSSRRRFAARAKHSLWIGFLSNRLRDGHQEIKFLIDPESRRQGYATEAVQIITNYLFTSQDIVRIQEETHPQNTPAINVLEKNGFTCEGVLRKNVFTRGARAPLKQPRLGIKESDDHIEKTI